MTNYFDNSEAIDAWFEKRRYICNAQFVFNVPIQFHI